MVGTFGIFAHNCTIVHSQQIVFAPPERGHFSSSENLPKIKANGKTLIPLTVSISEAPVVRELVDVINRGTAVSYDCSGSMSLLSGLPGLDIPDFFLDLQGNTRIR